MPIILAGCRVALLNGEIITLRPDSHSPERLASYDSAARSLPYPDQICGIKVRHDVTPDTSIHRQPVSCRLRGYVDVRSGGSSLVQPPLVVDANLGGLDSCEPITLEAAKTSDPTFVVSGTVQDPSALPCNIEKNCLIVEDDRDEVRGYFVAIRMAGRLDASVSEYPPGSFILSIARFSSLGCPTQSHLTSIMTFEPDTVQALGIGFYLEPSSWKGRRSDSKAITMSYAAQASGALWSGMSTDMTYSYAEEGAIVASPQEAMSTTFSLPTSTQLCEIECCAQKSLSQDDVSRFPPCHSTFNSSDRSAKYCKQAQGPQPHSWLPDIGHNADLPDLSQLQSQLINQSGRGSRVASEQLSGVCEKDGPGVPCQRVEQPSSGVPGGRQCCSDAVANDSARSFPIGAPETVSPLEARQYSDALSVPSSSFQGHWDTAMQEPNNGAERPTTQHSHSSLAPPLPQTRVGVQVAPLPMTWTAVGQVQGAHGQNAGTSHPGGVAASNHHPGRLAVPPPPPMSHQQPSGTLRPHRSAMIPPRPNHSPAAHPNDPASNTSTSTSSSVLRPTATEGWIMEDPSRPAQKTKTNKRSNQRAIGHPSSAELSHGNSVSQRGHPPPGPPVHDKSSHATGRPSAHQQGLPHRRAPAGSSSSGLASQSSSTSSIQSRGYPPASFSSHPSAPSVAVPKRTAGEGRVADQNDSSRFQAANNLIATQWHSLGLDGVVSSPWRFEDIGPIDVSSGAGTSQQAFNFGDGGLVGGQNQAKRMYGMAFGDGDAACMSQPQQRMRTA